MLFDQNPAFLLADRCSWLWSESWGWPCCVLEQGPDVLITTSRVILPSDCLLWSGYYEKKKQPLNFTNGLFDLNLLSFPPKNLHSILLIWSVVIIRFYYCICLQQCHLSCTQNCLRAKLLSSYLCTLLQEVFCGWGHWNSSCQLGDWSNCLCHFHNH